MWAIIMKPTKQNTLYLTIKQKYFDEIVAGTKKNEYREIKDTTATKYLDTWKEGGEMGLFLKEDAIDFDPQGDICIYNDGVYPYIPKDYKFLRLAVGYAKDRDEAVVEVVDITFEVMKTKEGKEARFDISRDDDFIADENGPYAIWMVNYHLGEVVEKKLK